MSLLALQFMRRLAVALVVLSLVLFVGPRLLRIVGVLGPTPEQSIQTAEASLTAAAAYGASPTDTAYAEATAELARARKASAAGDEREARSAAGHASEI